MIELATTSRHAMNVDLGTYEVSIYDTRKNSTTAILMFSGSKWYLLGSHKPFELVLEHLGRIVPRDKLDRAIKIVEHAYRRR